MRLNDMPIFDGALATGDKDTAEAYKFAFRDTGKFSSN